MVIQGGPRADHCEVMGLPKMAENKWVTEVITLLIGVISPHESNPTQKSEQDL